jgi:hypothetical protein
MICNVFDYGNGLALIDDVTCLDDKLFGGCKLNCVSKE